MPRRPFPSHGRVVGAILAGFSVFCTPQLTVAAEHDAKLERSSGVSRRVLPTAADGGHAAGRPPLRRSAGRPFGGGPGAGSSTPGDARTPCPRVDYEKLSPAGQIDFDILRHELTKSLWAAENPHRFEEDPRAYNDYISDSVFLLLTQSTLPKEKNIANCIARMKQIPKVLAAAQENLRNPPRVATETADPPEPRGHRLLRERHLRARRRDAAGRRDARRPPSRSSRA